jgi:phosphotransferase system enzyme I (PtsI)
MAPPHSKPSTEERIEGIGICAGIAIGTVFFVDDPRGHVVRLNLPEAQIEPEITRFREAVEIAQQQLQHVQNRLRAALGEEQAYILEAHVLLLQDQSLGRQVEGFIRNHRASAEWAVREVTNRLLAVYAGIADEYMSPSVSSPFEAAHNRALLLILTKMQF